MFNTNAFTKANGEEFRLLTPKEKALAKRNSGIINAK